LAALILAIITQISFRVRRRKSIGNPIMMKHKGIFSTIYSSIDNWKFIEFFPFSFTHADSSLFDNQQTSGPRTPPKGKK
jgi:hypothetical protein